LSPEEVVPLGLVTIHDKTFGQFPTAITVDKEPAGDIQLHPVGMVVF
jgi:hypothetical protein